MFLLSHYRAYSSKSRFNSFQ